MNWMGTSSSCVTIHVGQTERPMIRRGCAYRNKFGRVEQVEVEFVLVFLGNDLYTKVPLGESAAL